MLVQAGRIGLVLSSSKLENGKYNPSLKLAMDIAKFFGKTVEEVFIFEEDEDEE